MQSSVFFLPPANLPMCFTANIPRLWYETPTCIDHFVVEEADNKDGTSGSFSGTWNKNFQMKSCIIHRKYTNFATPQNNINYEDSSYDFIGSFVYGNNIN